MAAPKGNQFWKERASHGRKGLYATPDDLWEDCVEYFQWTEDNPLYESKAFAFQGVVTQEPVAKMRAMTLAGLYLFLDLCETTWVRYRGKEDFKGVVRKVESVIYQQKFSGAAADLLNPNIIARDLGLTDKQETAHSGHISTDLSDDELDRAIAERKQGLDEQG